MLELTTVHPSTGKKVTYQFDPVMNQSITTEGFCRRMIDWDACAIVYLRSGFDAIGFTAVTMTERQRELLLFFKPTARQIAEAEAAKEAAAEARMVQPEKPEPKAKQSWSMWK
ncbi:MAG: hypothetical protein WAX89_01410 [Alphaproteobacteria bacterium]